MNYEYIQYDGAIYHRVSMIDFPESLEHGESIYPIHIIDTSMSIRTDRSYEGREIVGAGGTRFLDSEGRIKYLFFDSAEWTIDE
jgi:hypothetical protein